MKPATILPLFAFGLATASPSPDISGEMHFNMGLLLPRQGGANNLQVFTGALGGAAASAITQSDDPKQPFEVDGSKFKDFKSAANRACDNQHNACANLANNKSGKFTVGQCDQQSSQCKDSIDTATKTSFTTSMLFSSTPDLDIFCDS